MQNNSSLNYKNMPAQKNAEVQEFLLIEISEKIFAVKALDVLEIIKMIELDYPNEMPSCILGIIKYEQTPTGVIDFREILKQERIVYDLSSKIIIIKTQNEISAFVCDKIIDIKKIETEKIRPLPYQNEKPFYDGVYIDGSENVYILNIQNIKDYISANPEKFTNRENSSRYIINDSESKQRLKKRKEFLSGLSKEIQTAAPLYDRGVSFLINNIKYYINMASVKEFFKVNNSKFIKIPNTPDFIMGLVNIKGEYITIIDIRLFYNNIKTTIKEKSTIIILNSDEFKIGILADEICESLDINYEEILQNRLKNQEEGKMNEFVKDGEIYQILDTEKLLKDERLTIC